MNALGEPAVSHPATALKNFTPCVAFVTPHKATYLKPLYESFAAAQPNPWRTLIVWPEEHRSEHPQELLTPVAKNLDVRRVVTRGIGGKFFGGRELQKVLSATDPQMIVIQEYSPFSIGGLRFARKRKIPVVVITEVGARNRHLFSRRAQLWHSICSRFVNGIAAACPAAHETISGRKLPSVSIYHAVDSQLYEPLPRQNNGPVIFAYLGQLIPRKGLDLWIAASRKLRDSGREDFKLRIIGGGDDAWLQSVIAAEGMGDKIECCGFLSGAAMREALGTSDVFVLPTRADTYAAVVHEAACLGLPLLVSKHAGAAEALVREDINGHIIDPDDSADFADKMLRLLDGSTRLRMSREARITANQLSAHQRGAALWHWMERTFINVSVSSVPCEMLQQQ